MVPPNNDAELSLPSDFRLLVALDALLQTESVTQAAKRLHLSPSAMSRTLHRIRHRLGDPILARAGRGMVVTPRGIELRERVHLLVREAEELFSSGEVNAMASAWRNFVLLVDDGYAGVLAPRLMSYDYPQIPGATFHFMSASQADPDALREGTAALEIGRVHSFSPELRVENLLFSRYVAVVRAGHELLNGTIDVERFANASHIDVLEADAAGAAVDSSLAKYDLRRRVTMTTHHYTTAFSVIGQTDLVAIAPEVILHPGLFKAGLRSFALPIPATPVAIRMAWHPRSEADPAHAWLRSRVRDTLRSRLPENGSPSD
ncbi:LysR family transcriptional regulator [Actinomadura decatromicini]|uniref:LysR family transcriptional regulator n=1 Tax=Actinomadura decatromicini TaxID=2604572 RepID=A0A5D3FXV9_9ACTN|nr:LysR family transcriptional regulator [Actinomadura decatromicini]TYK53161.1 LysR family transcriptional regulator [Actinomadura decatromicini]